MSEPERRPVLTRLGDLLTEWEQDAAAAYEARQTGQPRGPVTGLSALDRELGGALAPGLHVVHGQPGSGKTACALQVAAECGCPCLFVSCEMRSLELFRRVTARTTSTFLGRLKSGEYTPEQSLDLARRAAGAAPLLALCDATQAYASPGYLRDVAEAVRGDSRHLLLVVDSVHSWAESAGSDLQEYDAINAGLAALRGLASVLECPVLSVAERNRTSMKSGGLSAGAGSRKLEYGAESVWELSQDTDSSGNPKEADAGGELAVTLRLVKNRNGAPGKRIRLAFHGALQQFREESIPDPTQRREPCPPCLSDRQRPARFAPTARNPSLKTTE